MVSISDIEGVRVKVENTLYEIQEIAYGSNLDIIWPFTSSDGLFEAIRKDDAIVGIKALYDLHIIQEKDDADNDVLKNITKILRTLSMEDKEDAPLRSDRAIISKSYITAGALNPEVPEPSGDVLYIFDDWRQQGLEGWEEWALAAKLAIELKASLEALERRLNQGGEGEVGGGTGEGTNVFWENLSEFFASLNVAGESKELVLSNTIKELFNITETLLEIKKRTDKPRSLKVPGNITAEGYITAGAADGNATGDILYIFDDWAQQSIDGWETWALSAKLAAELSSRLTALERTGAGGGGDSGTGGGGSNVFWESETTNYAKLNVDGNAKELVLAKLIRDLLTINNDEVILKLVEGFTKRNFKIPGDLSVENVKASKNVVADGYITAGAKDGNATGDILYRLDSWRDYFENENGDWCPSAKIVNDRFNALESGSSSQNNVVIVDRYPDVMQEGVLYILVESM